MGAFCLAQESRRRAAREREEPNAPWWGIRVEGRSICWTGTLEGADEQSPEFLAGRIREAVQLGLMQAALPPRRGRG